MSVAGWHGLVGAVLTVRQPRENYAQVARAIARFEPVTMVVRPQDRVAAQLALGTEVDCLELPIDDGWFRDNGPNFLINDADDLAGACFDFNAWGGNYAPFDADAAAGPKVVSHLAARLFRSPMVAEGGGITVDGEGTLMTTETCFLNPIETRAGARVRSKRSCAACWA